MALKEKLKSKLKKTTNGAIDGGKFPNVLSIDDNDLPEIKDWEIGKTYTVKLKVKMVRKSQGNEYGPLEEGGKNTDVHASFHIIDADCDED